MKKMIYRILPAILMSTSWLSAQVDFGDNSSANIEPVAAEEDCGGPFKIEVAADYVGEAKIKKNCHGLKDVTFATGIAEVNFVFYYDKCYKEGAAIAVGYERTYLDVKNNPYFKQRDFDTVSVFLSGFTERACDWEWRGQVTVNFDNIESWNYSDYMNYDLLLWGRYHYCEDIGLHIGFLAQTGMKIDRVYPVIGIDWKYNCDWKFNLIFPLNISVVYTITPSWSVSVASRFFDQRHRAKKSHEGLFSEALWSYRTAGGELALMYNPTKCITANIHGGYDFGGHLKIADRHYHHRKRLRLDGAPYAGASLDWNF